MSFLFVFTSCLALAQETLDEFYFSNNESVGESNSYLLRRDSSLIMTRFVVDYSTKPTCVGNWYIKDTKIVMEISGEKNMYNLRTFHSHLFLVPEDFNFADFEQVVFESFERDEFRKMLEADLLFNPSVKKTMREIEFDLLYDETEGLPIFIAPHEMRSFLASKNLKKHRKVKACF